MSEERDAREATIRFHPRSSIYRDIIKELYKTIVERGVLPSDALYDLLLHVLNVYVFRRRWLRRQFALLLKQMLVERYGFDEATATEMVDRFMESGSHEALVDVFYKHMYEKMVKDKKVVNIEIDAVAEEAAKQAKSIIVEAAEAFLLDIGLI